MDSSDSAMQLNWSGLGTNNRSFQSENTVNVNLWREVQYIFTPLTDTSSTLVAYTDYKRQQTRLKSVDQKILRKNVMRTCIRARFS